MIQDLPVVEGGRMNGIRGQEAADVLQAPLAPVFDLGVVSGVVFENVWKLGLIVGKLPGVSSTLPVKRRIDLDMQDRGDGGNTA